jgi:hypothetical protein
MTDVSFKVVLDDQLAEAAHAAARAFRDLFHSILEWAVRLARALAVLLDGVLKVLGVFRRHDVLLVAVHDGWRGLSLRHALRPPTRGYWAKRCTCQACSLRAFQRV